MTSQRKSLNRNLLDAVITRDTARARDLINKGAEVNARDAEHGETALMLAVKFADAELVQLLLAAGAEVDVRDDQGRTALYLAEAGSEAFEALRQAGADVYVRDRDGETLLHRAVGACASMAQIEVLLRVGVDPQATNHDGATALDVAEGLGLLAIAERLRGATRAN